MKNRYTYDDLARYFGAIRGFRVFDLQYNDSIYGTMRERTTGENGWDSLYVPVIKRN